MSMTRGMTPALALAIALISGCTIRDCIVPEVEPLTAAADCARCHQVEEQTWRASPHARAFVSNGFKERTHDYTVGECISCHAPAAPPLEAATTGPAAERLRPLLRKDARTEGVTCVSCHAFGHDAEPRATARKLFHGDGAAIRSAPFCGRCHEDTFREWSTLAEASRFDCAKCHMPRVGPGSTESDHSLLHDRETLSKSAVAIDVVEARRDRRGAAGGKDAKAAPGRVLARVALENIAADHALPTGGYGFRDLRVTVDVIDRAGRPVASRALDVVVAGRGDARPLAPRERREVAFELADPDALGVAVRARLEKAGPWGPEPAPRASALKEVE
jgi:hypothetical protein